MSRLQGGEESGDNINLFSLVVNVIYDAVGGRQSRKFYVDIDCRHLTFNMIMLTFRASVHIAPSLHCSEG